MSGKGKEKKKSWREAVKVLQESEPLVGELSLQNCCFRMYLLFSRMLSGQVEALSQMLEVPLCVERWFPKRRNEAPHGKMKH